MYHESLLMYTGIMADEKCFGCQKEVDGWRFCDECFVSMYGHPIFCVYCKGVHLYVNCPVAQEDREKAKGQQCA